MDTGHSPFPDTRPMPRGADVPGPHGLAAPTDANASRRDRSPQVLSERSLATLAELQRDGIAAAILAERFPHVVNRMSDRWDTPTRLLEEIGELLVDRRGGRRGFPEEALGIILAIRRHTVRRIVAAAGLPPPDGAGLSPGRCTPSSPS